MDKGLTIRYNEETGLWEKHEPFITIDVMTEEEFNLVKAAVEHYQKRGCWKDVQEEELYCPDIKATIIRTTQTCSYCKTRIGFIGPKQYLFDDYCPGCGATMEKE